MDQLCKTQKQILGFYTWLLILTDDCVLNDDTSIEWLVLKILLGKPLSAFTLYCTENVDSIGCTVRAEGLNSNEIPYHKSITI